MLIHQVVLRIHPAFGMDLNAILIFVLLMLMILLALLIQLVNGLAQNVKFSVLRDQAPRTVHSTQNAFGQTMLVLLILAKFTLRMLNVELNQVACGRLHHQLAQQIHALQRQVAQPVGQKPHASGQDHYAILTHATLTVMKRHVEMTNHVLGLTINAL